LHVGAAEAVDGLLGIADHGQGVAGRRLDEDALEDRPLHLVGVLEFVDQGVAVAAAQGFDERASRGPGSASARATRLSMSEKSNSPALRLRRAARSLTSGESRSARKASKGTAAS
jgi:hypothetical protein